jgi:hypothetical protein
MNIEGDCLRIGEGRICIDGYLRRVGIDWSRVDMDVANLAGDIRRIEGMVLKLGVDWRMNQCDGTSPATGRLHSTARGSDCQHLARAAVGAKPRTPIRGD